MSSRRSVAKPLALLYAVLIVYASLYPFTGWSDRGLSPFAFLAAPWPKYWTAFDLITNFLGYVPFGLLLVLAGAHKQPIAWVVLGAVALAAALSLLMEALQTYLPQRVASNLDWATNAAGAGLGAWLAYLLDSMGVMSRWQRWRGRWFVDDACGALVLLGLWPLGLLYPTPVPFGLGQVLERLHSYGLALLGDTVWASWWPDTLHLLPLRPWHELCSMVCGILAPCLLANTVVPVPAKKISMSGAIFLLAIGVAGMSGALTWGPEHAWAWWTSTVELAMMLAAFVALGAAFTGRWANAVLLAMVLLVSVGLLNLAPQTAYATSTLQTWEQGRFIHFHGLTQWVGWLWPYLAMLWLGIGMWAGDELTTGLGREGVSASSEGIKK